MSADERKLLDQTTLHDYIFEWGPNRKQCCMAIGYVPFTIIPINPIVNTKWILMPESITITTVRIHKGRGRAFH